MISNTDEDEKKIQQAGAELCQAQVKLEVIVDVVEEAWELKLELYASFQRSFRTSPVGG